MKDGAWVHAVMEKTRPSELECHIVNSNDLKTVLGLMSFASIYLYSQVRLGATVPSCLLRVWWLSTVVHGLECNNLSPTLYKYVGPLDYLELSRYLTSITPWPVL